MQVEQNEKWNVLMTILLSKILADKALSGSPSNHTNCAKFHTLIKIDAMHLMKLLWIWPITHMAYLFGALRIFNLVISTHNLDPNIFLMPIMSWSNDLGILPYQRITYIFLYVTIFYFTSFKTKNFQLVYSIL
jgi:hypothetical protein